MLIAVATDREQRLMTEAEFTRYFPVLYHITNGGAGRLGSGREIERHEENGSDATKSEDVRRAMNGRANRPDSGLDSDRYYQAAVARDHRFDGLFFTAVRTTRLYCRPICPGRAKRENVEFFQRADDAEAAGYRPCLRCRPEDAPPALTEITRDSSGATEGATRGSEKHNERHNGKSDVVRDLTEVMRNARLDFSRKLVVETGLSLDAIAGLSGFESELQFAKAFEARFRRAPTHLRRFRPGGRGGAIELALPYRPPLDWQGLLNFYRTHLISGPETVGENFYERVFEVGAASGVFRVEADPSKPCLRLRVSTEDPSVLFAVYSRVRVMLDLDADPMAVGELLESHAVIGPLWKERPGLRIARGWDPFEVSVSTILGQLVSTGQARSLVRQLVESHGKTVPHPVTGKPVRLFPDPRVLASAKMQEVRTSEARKQAVRGLSGHVASRTIDLGGGDIEALKARLLALPGIGHWTSEYIALRGLGDRDAFPGTDLVLKRALARHPEIDLNALRPWRGYAAVHLWASAT